MTRLVQSHLWVFKDNFLVRFCLPFCPMGGQSCADKYIHKFDQQESNLASDNDQHPWLMRLLTESVKLGRNLAISFCGFPARSKSSIVIQSDEWRYVKLRCPLPMSCVGCTPHSQQYKIMTCVGKTTSFVGGYGFQLGQP